MATWQISGEYMETCNCKLLCPCITSNLAATPTEGDCKAALTLRIFFGPVLHRLVTLMPAGERLRGVLLFPKEGAPVLPGTPAPLSQLSEP